MPGDRAQEVALFRYRLAREAADESLTARERGQLVRALAAREHLGPDGTWVRVSRNTLDRWVRSYRRGGFDALVPTARRVDSKIPAHVLELACALRREQPARTAAQIHRIILESEGWAPHARTLQRHLAVAGLHWRGQQPVRAFGRFEADRPNLLWTGDALHGPRVGGRKTFLFAFIDDHSRLLTGYRWATREDVLNASRALRAGLAARGVPEAIYVDNGSPFVSGQLLRACARMGMRLVHSRPGKPQGRGKIERVFRTVREQVLVELEHQPPADLEHLNRLFQTWVEHEYHHRAHSQTGQPPLQRFLAPGAPKLPEEARLREAFRWSEHRTVSATGTVSMFGNLYELAPELAHRRIELVFDPLDLTQVEVHRDGTAVGFAVVLEITRHVHPRARLEEPDEPTPPRTGIDYLSLVETRRKRELQRRIDYRNLPRPEAAGHDEDEERSA